MIRKLLLLLAFVLTTSAWPQEKATPDVSSSFLGKFFGKQEDFPELKKLRRQLIAEISRLERDVRTLEIQAEQLTAQLEESQIEISRLNARLRTLDTAIANKAKTTPGALPKAEPQVFGNPLPPMSEEEYLSRQTIEQLRNSKSDTEQRLKDISERQQRLVLNKEEQRKKRDELELKQARLIELEDRISVALSTGSLQYIYRTIISLIFAAIVAFLVLQFFRIVQQNDDVKKSIFTGDTGIQFITLFSIVIAVILFGILEILGANELSALLGGLSGYILGKSNTRSTQ